MHHDLAIEDDGEVDPVILAARLSSVGYRVAVRSALGAASGTIDCFYNLRNEFLVVTAESTLQPSPFAGPGAAEPPRQHYIVESRFREHFTIPAPTERYARVLAEIPEVLVASPAALAPLVQLLCSEMSMAFEERGMALPPWRQLKSFMSKWLPTNARDYDVEVSPCGSPRARPASPTAAPASGALSTLTSGALTPSDALGDDSPRAVLRDVAAALSKSTAKPIRSQLSVELQAASGGTSPKASRPTAQSPTTAGWATPPIRRVRMGGAPKF